MALISTMPSMQRQHSKVLWHRHLLAELEIDNGVWAQILGRWLLRSANATPCP